GDASATGAGKTLLTPPFAALIWGAGKAGVASDRLTVTELTREDLADQHVCGLNTDADDPRDKTDHRVWAFLSIAVSFELLQARFLDRSDLLTHHMETCEVTTARVFSGKGDPSAVRSSLSCCSALRNFSRNVRMPKRVRIALIWFPMLVCSVTRLSRSRFGRLASSSSIVGIATMLP